jgi:hypothetical protein
LLLGRGAGLLGLRCAARGRKKGQVGWADRAAQ